MSEINEEKEKKKPVSKLGAMLSNNQEVNNSQVCVYYSQNNWKTSEVVEVMIEEKTTVLQLIDMVIFKLKTEFYYDNIDEKNCILMLLKKKTKTPNYDYPKCNPESVVLNYNKSNFCLVEVNSTKSDNINESEKKNNDVAKDAIMGNVGNENQNKKEEKREELKNEIKKEDNKEQNNKSNKSNKNKKKTSVKACDKSCIIF
jgi:hypothetical protein